MTSHSPRKAIWYVTHRGDPYYNMAFDEWLFRLALTERDLVAFRLYSWEPGGITIGVNQRSEIAVDWSAVGETPVIRRVTGGRALYHDPSELTYSIALGESIVDACAGESLIAGISKTIAGGLADFLLKIGVDAEFVRRSSPVDRRPVARQSAPCFASSARYEFTSHGGKVIASAQRRIGDAVLQHGSIKLFGVASHPALNFSGAEAGALNCLQPVDAENVTLLSRVLFSSLACSFNRDAIEPGVINDTFDQQNVATLKSAPLERRFIF